MSDLEGWGYNYVKCPMGCGSFILWDIKEEIYVCPHPKCGWKDWTSKITGERRRFK